MIFTEFHSVLMSLYLNEYTTSEYSQNNIPTRYECELHYFQYAIYPGSSGHLVGSLLLLRMSALSDVNTLSEF